MAYIRPLPNGKFHADIRLKGIVKNKTFPSESLAHSWSESMEHQIRSIPLLNKAQLASLSDIEIESMGGAELFKLLGIDLFAVRHAIKLDAINALSKKELLQLTTQEIERMGGVELFIQAGKRIRYKTFREVCTEYFPAGAKKTIKARCNALSIGAIYSAIES